MPPQYTRIWMAASSSASSSRNSPATLTRQGSSQSAECTMFRERTTSSPETKTPAAKTANAKGYQNEPLTS